MKKLIHNLYENETKYIDEIYGDLIYENYNIAKQNGDTLIEKEPFYSKITNMIIEKLKKFSVEEIEKKFKLKNEKARKLLEFYANYENEKSGNALASYTGVAYKAIKIETFNKDDFEYLESHLVILSALYGVLTPYTNVIRFLRISRFMKSGKTA